VTDQPPLDVAVQRGRLMRMIAIDALCVVVAAGAIVGDVAWHVGWLIWVFAAALVAGFAAQIWLVAGLIQKH
jgi:hypothetical protein